MSNKFVNYETVIEENWCNTVDQTVFVALGEATTPTQARTHIGAIPDAPSDGTQYVRRNAAWSALSVSANNPIVVDDAAELSALETTYDAAILDADLWVWSDDDLSAQVTADPEQTHVVAPDTAPTGVDGAYIRTGPKDEYRLEKFSTELDETAWERAADFLEPGQTLIVPANGIYQFTQGVTFTQNNLTLKSSGNSLTTPLIGAHKLDGTLAITLLKMTGNNCRVTGLNFVGTEYDRNEIQAALAYSSVVAIDFSRGGNEESYANLDHELERCYFGGLDTAVTGAGRNVGLNLCTFYECRVGVAPLVYSWTGNNKSPTRGWRVTNCWFQGMSLPLINMNQMSTETACILTPIDEDIVQGDWASSNYIINNNFVDNCGPFYVGTLNMTRISGNHDYNAHGPLVTCHPGQGVLINAAGYGRFGHITDNDFWGVVQESAETIKNAEYFVDMASTLYCKISGNTASFTAKAILKAINVCAVHVSNETYYGANYGYDWAEDHGAIHIQPLQTDDLDQYCSIQSSHITPKPTVEYFRGIHCSAAASYLFVDNCYIAPGRDTDYPLVYPATVRKWHRDNQGDIHANAHRLRLNDTVMDQRLTRLNVDGNQVAFSSIVTSNIVAGENLAVGNGVYLYESGNPVVAKWGLWDATSSSKCGKIGIVITAANTGEYPEVVTWGPAYLSSFTVPSGKLLYMSESTAGDIQYTVPRTAGGNAQQIGYGLDNIGVFVQPGPVVLTGTEVTDELTTITYTAPSSPDYALQALTNSSGYGFATADEGHTVLSVVANLQARVKELEDRLSAHGLIADAD